VCRSEEFCESGMGRGVTMPVSFLTNVQKQCYGRYTGEPTMAQLTKRRRVREAGLLPPPALRTGRESFPSSGSSISKAV